MVDFAGIEGTLKKFIVSYRGVDFPYEDLKYYGKITNKFIDNSAGFVEIELSLENADGKITTPCSALVELPIKNK